MYETIHEALRESFYRNEAVESRIARYEELVLSDKKSSFVAAASCSTAISKTSGNKRQTGRTVARRHDRTFRYIDSVPNVPRFSVEKPQTGRESGSEDRPGFRRLP